VAVVNKEGKELLRVIQTLVNPEATNPTFRVVEEFLSRRTTPKPLPGRQNIRLN
jgi:hypothetical protein